MAKWPPKDPDEVLDYAFSWTPRNIGDDTITTPTADVVEPNEGAGDLAVDSTATANDAQLAKYNAEEAAEATRLGRAPSPALPGQLQIVWLSKGIGETTRTIQLHAVTAADRQLDQKVTIKIKER